MKCSRTLLKSAVIAALGGLLFGFDTVVISGAEQQLEKIFTPAADLSAWWAKFWHGFLMASALIGTVIGSMAVGKPSDQLGRRHVMFWLALLFFVSAVGSALAWDWYSLSIFRFIGGLGVGGASVVSPMYIAEISPAKIRGRLVALAQFNIVLGILLAFISNLVIASLQLGETEWRWMFGVETIPAAAYFLLLFATPRSPRWLVAKGRDEEARAVLEQVGVDESVGSVDGCLAAIRQSIDLEHHDLEEPFFQRKYLKPIMLAFAIAAFNQLSGINAVLYYSKRIFESAGFDENAGLLNSVGLGLVNLVFTMIGLALIDGFGRKKLMLVGSVGYILSLGIIAWSFYTQQTVDGGFTELGGWVVFASLLAFIASHAVGQGAVIWVFIGEIFPNRLRARGQAFGSFTHWIFAAAISQTFPLIAEQSGAHVFAFYSICMVGQLIWVLTKMPETKNIPLEEIQKRLGID
ncbi:MAG: sugar porter family MFS transporter [Planctomycetes bacterium]|nr:sugar porter family MFS transporter [Planctomycetota bacterium]